MDIEQWLRKFRTAWSNYDIEGVLELFTEDVEYWESPHQKVSSRAELRKEWGAILMQKEIEIHTDQYSSSGELHTIIWSLSYFLDDVQHKWGGVYLIKLNSKGFCEYFFQTGEKAVE